MAVKSKAVAKTGVNQLPKADAFLNLNVVDANGQAHRLPKGLALYIKDKVSASMINAEKRNLDAAAAAGAEPVAITFTLTGTIWIPQEDDGTEIPFGF